MLKSNRKVNAIKTTFEDYCGELRFRSLVASYFKWLTGTLSIHPRAEHETAGLP